MKALDWYPKQYGPGDMAGEGARRLLGTPSLPTVAVLVREAAQNSWDARINSRIEFELHLRQLTRRQTTLLRDVILTPPAPGTDLEKSLEAERVWALEINDRGTSGLGGPVRNDLAVPEGTPTDFIDFVMNIGAPRDTHLGGGTYGFGKTISYVASRPGTVVIWSRSAHDKGEHRFIASAMGDHFELDGRRYTGRHWWGRRDSDDGGDRIVPLLGKEGRTVGGSLFGRRFEGGETGTSILVIDPQLGGDSPEESAERLAEAALWNLWPKLLPAGPDHAEMQIRVLLNSREVPIGDPLEHPVLKAFADGLCAVRGAQEGHPYEAQLPLSLEPIDMGRPIKSLGHLALTRYPITGGRVTPGHLEDLLPIDSESRHVALMRHDAELIVKYQPYQGLDVDGFQWAGVFKPVESTDDSFAAAEPPAHDDWVPASVQDAAMKSEVNVSLNRIRSAVKDFLLPAVHDDSSDADAATGAARLGDALADIVAGVDGSRPTSQSTSSPARNGGGSAQPRAEVVQIEYGPLSRSGLRRVGVRVIPDSRDSEPVRLRGEVSVIVDGGQDSGAHLARIIGWEDFPDVRPVPGEQECPEMVTADPIWMIVEMRRELAFEVRIKATEV